MQESDGDHSVFKVTWSKNNKMMEDLTTLTTDAKHARVEQDALTGNELE